MSCKPAYFGGLGDCKALFEKMNGIVLQKKGETWTDDTIIAASSFQTVLADDDSDVRNAMAFRVLSFENTTDDVEILTSPLGKKSKGGDPYPSGVVYLQGSFNDYKLLYDHEGIEYDAILFYQDGSHWVTRKTDLTLKGLRCSFGTKAGLPPEDPNTSFPMYIFFDSVQEFKKVEIVSDYDWIYSELIDYVPVGLDFRVTTAYSAGDVIVQVDKRGTGEGMTGLVAGDFEVMKSNAEPTVVVTALVEDGLGQYTLTIQKDNDGTPANLAATDYVYLQCHDDDATNLTYLSNAIKLFGGA